MPAGDCQFFSSVPLFHLAQSCKKSDDTLVRSVGSQQWFTTCSNGEYYFANWGSISKFQQKIFVYIGAMRFHKNHFFKFTIYLRLPFHKLQYKRKVLVICLWIDSLRPAPLSQRFCWCFPLKTCILYNTSLSLYFFFCIWGFGTVALMGHKSCYSTSLNFPLGHSRPIWEKFFLFIIS